MKDFLDYAASRYYDGNPVITDAEFDALAKKYNYENVGARVDLTRAVAHTYPMYSLQKCYVGEDAIALPGFVIDTVKLDGAAISALYIGGKLVQALTRGDGKAGLDITDKMATLLPNTIPHKELLQVKGEVVASKTIPNSRNYAAGALNLKSFEEFKTREVLFVAYGCDPFISEDYFGDMCFLNSFGFDTVIDPDFNIDQFPTDGTVFRVNNNNVYQKLGFTAKHPHGAYALKEIQAGLITTITDIVWQVGRSGVVTPIAILEPVNIGGAIVTRATLHNYRFIVDKNLEIGCSVEVIRSGEIIPKILRRIDEDVT